jgi:hypothetical protein
MKNKKICSRSRQFSRKRTSFIDTTIRVSFIENKNNRNFIEFMDVDNTDVLPTETPVSF